MSRLVKYLIILAFTFAMTGTAAILIGLLAGIYSGKLLHP